LLTGESTALGLLGEIQRALSAQGAAVRLSPDSPELLLRLAEQEQRTGEFAVVRQVAERALAWTVADPMVQASRARFITLKPMANDFGYLGLSVGSDRPRVVVPTSAHGCGGGGFTTLAASIPIPPSDDASASLRLHTNPLPDASLEMSLAASTVLGDVTQAKADLDRWEQLFRSGSKDALSIAWTGRNNTLATGASAPALLGAGILAGGERPAGTTFESAFHFAESRLRQAGVDSGQSRFFTLASAVCERAAVADPSLASHAQQCQAESEYYAGHPGTAEAMLQGLAQKTDGSVEPVVGIEAAFAAWKAKDLERSRLLLQQAVDLWTRAPSDGELNFALANELFGEYLLDQSEPSSATGYLRAALSSAQHAVAKQDYINKRQGGLIGRAVIEHAANNLGIDLLWLAKQGAESTPDCGRRKSTCLDARGSFETALSIDSSDPTVLLNFGWVLRLLGDTRASQIALTRAVEIDSRDYPALNDLGWLAAGGGEQSVARRALEQALAVRPDDDIAAWNLGVLSLQSGPWGIPQGEAYLARAIRENRKLREEPFGYRTDERIYRQSYGTTIEPVTTKELDSRLGGGMFALGTVGALASVASGTGVQLEDQLVEILGERRLPGSDRVANLLGFLRRRRQTANTASRRRLRSAGRWVFSAALISGIAIWSAWPESESARASVLTLALVGTGLALLVHEAGHLAAACFAGVKFLPVWPGRAAIISVAMLPLGISDGPFPGHRAAPGTRFERAKGVYFAGLVANLLVGISLYGLYLIQPMPALRLFAELQLSVAAFSVLPLRPLDGAAFRRHREWALLLAPLAFVVVVAGLLFRAKML
jgi:tetratricopeptide (TPR) repeat protein